MKWSLYAILYLIGVLTMGLLLVGVEQVIAAALDLVFLVIAIVLFRVAAKDVSAALDIAADDKERVELRMVQALLISTFVISATVLAYGFLKALFPFIP
ncbi:MULTISPECIES: hypothetical protein [Pyrobaculum]|uniref:DUF2178 domain-containing protein n=2 Tax=Pyrobaculum arsenaticum TaxID=121277 RepID=A4WIH6_PYRAR|nr:hypothetical protein [Pyrobaculum arsenaticum]ABP50193.1 conserved hypothetical protein [Pyrobaculum arsenaticum DSM 13514]MCY0889913.1 hypothetical protein [Pyrobaculum arsenaticum]NYR14869.1 hypothetical protein [Pyrobaculum arsenaticum]